MDARHALRAPERNCLTLCVTTQARSGGRSRRRESPRPSCRRVRACSRSSASAGGSPAEQYGGTPRRAVRPRTLGGAVPSVISHAGFGAHQTGGSHACRAPRIAWLAPVRDSNSAISHPNPSKTAFALGADAPFQQQAGTTSRCGVSSTLHRNRPPSRGSLHRDDAGRLGVPRPRTWIVIVVAYRESKYPDDTGLAYPTARSADSAESRGKMVSPRGRSGLSIF